MAATTTSRSPFNFSSTYLRARPYCRVAARTTSRSLLKASSANFKARPRTETTLITKSRSLFRSSPAYWKAAGSWTTAANAVLASLRISSDASFRASPCFVTAAKTTSRSFWNSEAYSSNLPFFATTSKTAFLSLLTLASANSKTLRLLSCAAANARNTKSRSRFNVESAYWKFTPLCRTATSTASLSVLTSGLANFSDAPLRFK
mmetsp:Transcript_0/g.2  ORF Transcript_0/g.2 Transcript_0/m.2 type:complete len:205 (-) Transcript_0:253-867(-)